MTKYEAELMHNVYEDKTKIINEIYDILHKPEYEYLFSRMLAEIIARYVMIARRVEEDKNNE